jgi:GH35 family endo-1,4-beta-xylanase
MSADGGVLDGAAERIARIRQGGLSVLVTDPDGTPLPGRSLRVRQLRSSFLFGCNIFALKPEDESAGQCEYQDRFTALLNFATLPFYWGGYEREPGRRDEARLRAMAQWCADRGIRTKGHPLVWHEVYPAWADEGPKPARELLEERVREIAAGFAGLVDTWDVINESTVSHRFDNGVGRWAKEVGMTAIAAECMRWARDAAPQATLLLNDFNVSPDYERQIEEVLATDGRFDVIGIQSHMHAGEWPLERAWEVCETYGRFGLPLHATELSVVSGEHVPDGTNFSAYRPAEWPSTPEGEERQCEYVEALYTLLFSHPAVEAVTWWDLPDGHWMNAPSGLLRRDLSPKPAYERLLELVTKEWRTDETVATEADGRARLTAFHGDYEVSDVATGQALECAHAADAPAEATLRLA